MQITQILYSWITSLSCEHGLTETHCFHSA